MQYEGHNTPQCHGVYWGLSTAVFLIFTTRLNTFFSVFFYLHHLVMSLKYSFLNTIYQTAILHAAHCRRVVKLLTYSFTPIRYRVSDAYK